MAIFDFGNKQLYYDLSGPEDAPVVVFVNGLTQATRLWAPYVEHFTRAGYRILTYDLLGQGGSSKPVLFIEFSEHGADLARLLDHLKIEQAYIAGVSFGGIIVLRFGIDFPDRVRGLIPMSTFVEMDARMRWMGESLYMGMVGIGFEYLQRTLMPLNVSSDWIEAHESGMPEILRAGFTGNDLYAIQNLMESLRDFKGFTPELAEIQKPTMIMNAEYDYFTPRHYHETIRKQIKTSRLVLIQRACHAFTLELPEITCRMIQHFMDLVESGQWQGDQSVWIAEEDVASAAPWFPCPGDHTRAIPTEPLPKPQTVTAPARETAPIASRKKTAAASRKKAPAVRKKTTKRVPVTKSTRSKS